MNRLYPSMMCVKPDDTRRYCEIFKENGIAGLHIDIMDGSFVPNFTLGTDYCRYLREISPLPLDIHLMIDKPEDKIKWFPIREGDKRGRYRFRSCGKHKSSLPRHGQNPRSGRASVCCDKSRNTAGGNRRSASFCRGFSPYDNKPRLCGAEADRTDDR